LVKEHKTPGFLNVLESKLSPAEGFCQDAGEKYPLAEGFYQVPGDECSPVWLLCQLIKGKFSPANPNRSGKLDKFSLK